VLNGLVLTALVVGLAAADGYVGGRAIFSAVLAALVAVALWEFYRLAERAGARPAGPYGIAFGVLLVAAQWVGARWVVPLDPLAFAAAVALFGAVAVHVAGRGFQGVWPDLGATVLGLALIGLPAFFIARIRVLGWGPLVLFVVTVKMSDVAAYLVGRAIGRRPLAPVVSPNKTIAGAVGALIVGTLTALAFRLVWPTGCAGLGLAGAALFGVAVTAFGMLGDLGESALKRAASAKDASRLLPGFGGVLDVLDSLWGAAPAAYAIFILAGVA